MIKQRPFLVGAVCGAALLPFLWGGVAYQFGSIGNGFRYLQGYNYVVRPTAIDVGTGMRGETREATATVRNLAFSPIRVIGVVTTCNCLTVTGLPVTIAPRQSKDMQFSIYLESAGGNVEQMATLFIDDGQMQRTPLVVTGSCTPSK